MELPMGSLHQLSPVLSNGFKVLPDNRTTDVGAIPMTREKRTQLDKNTLNRLQNETAAFEQRWERVSPAVRRWKVKLGLLAFALLLCRCGADWAQSVTAEPRYSP